MGTINRNIELPPQSPDAPGMFRCAKEGLMSELFSRAGLKNILQNNISGKLNCNTTDVYWNFMTEVVAPIVAVLSNADEAMKEKIKMELYNIMSERYPDGNVKIDSSSIVIYGEK
jgi:hypothetical protein